MNDDVNEKITRGYTGLRKGGVLANQSSPYQFMALKGCVPQTDLHGDIPWPFEYRGY